ncbi:MAG: alpha/beta fold hydrolase [Methylovirgula sp.]|nr:alpha/beta fold hydrolase [Methylovirgula sp.]
MRTSDADILIIPGLGGSGPDHWQSRWEAKLSTARRVAQKDLDRPQLTDWRGAIAAAVAEAERPVVLVAHSLGALAATDIAAELGDKVRGSFLVAPPSLRAVREMEAIDPEFAGLALKTLPFPSVLVASRDDPYSTFAESEDLARAWQAEIADAGNAGHINAASGHGPWPEGLMRLAGFLKNL